MSTQANRTEDLALQCAADGCERAWMRTRDGQRFCMFHPEAEPPTDEQIEQAKAAWYKTQQRSRAQLRRRQQAEDLEALLELDAQSPPAFPGGDVDDDKPAPRPRRQPAAVVDIRSHMKDPVSESVSVQGEAAGQPEAERRDGVDSHDVEPTADYGRPWPVDAPSDPTPLDGAGVEAVQPDTADTAPADGLDGSPTPTVTLGVNAAEAIENHRRIAAGFERLGYTAAAALPQDLVDRLQAEDPAVGDLERRRREHPVQDDPAPRGLRRLFRRRQR